MPIFCHNGPFAPGFRALRPGGERGAKTRYRRKAAPNSFFKKYFI